MALDLGRAWDTQPWTPDPTGLSRTVSFELDEATALEGAALRLEGLWFRARVRVNDQDLPPVTGGNAPITLPVGAALVHGHNTLQIHIAPPTAAQSRQETGGGIASSQFDPTHAELRVAPQLVLRPAVHLGGLALTALADTVTARARVPAAPAGARVHFQAVLDGLLVQDLGSVDVTDDLAITPATPWRGPRWDLGHPALLQLHATLTDAHGTVLDRLSQRTGVRSLTAGPVGLQINGHTTRLLAARMTVLARGAPLAERIQAVLPGGVNAIEIHGEMASSAWLDLADTLGLPVILLPRCIGRTKPLQSPTQRLQKILIDQDQRLIELALAHPSVVIWETEGPIRQGKKDRPLARLWTSALIDDPHQRPVIGLQYPGRVFRIRGSEDPCAHDTCRGAWITEVTRRDPSMSWQQVATTMQAAFDQGAIGGVLPTPAPGGDAGWAPAFANLAQRVQATPYAPSALRQPSTLTLDGLTPGTAVWLDAPGLSGQGTIADARGQATLRAWYRGPATLHGDGPDRPVELQ